MLLGAAAVAVPLGSGVCGVGAPWRPLLMAQLKLLVSRGRGRASSVTLASSPRPKPQPALTRHLAHRPLLVAPTTRRLALPFFYPPTPLAQPSDPSRTFFFVQSPVLP
ncbi:hypothetical protein XA68_10366 [Ophiocordyceps unilateralis]|uniref:Secreted protein n=1 Tax=Ophiocordyceps unilateralis TaxID=268505 RepID=A0A2A9NZ71_OPHUN|nr:hypothetical protein XA68_10366 [Ophiocordyceps unilateralis]